MKTSPTTPVWMLYLLAPMMALAQNEPLTERSRENQHVISSPLFWYWVAVLVVAAAAFAFITFRLSRRRQPPHRPSTP